MHPRTWPGLLVLCALGGSAACSGAGGGYYFPEDAEPVDAAPVDDAAPDGATLDGATPTFDVPTCPAPRTTCNGRCVDPTSDLLNCGGCDRRCTSGEACVESACRLPMPACAPPRAMCGAACVDTLTDRANCGACGRACPSGTPCSDGSCSATPACAPPRSMCGASCVDTQTDSANCATCGRACLSGQRCTAGVCTTAPPACAPPRMMCGAACLSVDSDPANCGFCDVRCAAGQTCTMGLCFGGPTCALPRVMCPSGCTDVQTDPANCGGCAVRCATGQACALGRCQATSGTTSRAGAVCTMPDPMGGTDPACNGLLCIPSDGAPFCTDNCTNSASQATEQAMCGGAGSTCLTQGDPPDDSSLCVASCRPSGTSVATGACRAGFVCTGWWYTHASSTPDAPGCFPFCTSSASCPSGQVCNPRVGGCGATGAVTTRLADGSPCNPTITVMVPGEMQPQNVQCRGLCFGVSSSSRTQGICGSFIDLRQTTSCPDTPTLIGPLAPPGVDNLAICIFKDCARNRECTTPLVCRYDETAAGVPDTTSQPNCQYPSARQPGGIP